AARRFDARRGHPPSLRAELVTLAACAGHVVRRRCPAGLTMVAHSAGRVREGARERLLPSPRPVHDASSARNAAPSDDFLSGESGTVAGLDAASRQLRDLAVDVSEIASAKRLRLRAAARHAPPR